MITVHDCPVSCGVKYIGGETNYINPENYLSDLHTRLSGSGMFSKLGKITQNQFIFTHRVDLFKIGSEIEQYITTHNLGHIVRSAQSPNPVYDDKHPIVVWVWTKNDNFNKHFAALKEAKAKKADEDRAKLTKQAKLDMIAAEQKAEAAEEKVNDDAL